MHQKEEETLAAIPAADVQEGEPLAPEVEAEAAAEAARGGRLQHESEVQLGLEEDGQVGPAMSVQVGRSAGRRRAAEWACIAPTCLGVE